MTNWRVFLKKKRHPSIFIAFFAAALLIGVVLSLVRPNFFFSLFWLLIGVALLIACLLFRFSWLILLICVSGLLVGLWRGDQLLFALKDYQPLIGSSVALVGTINQDVVKGKFGDKQVYLHNITIKHKKLPGEIFASVKTTQRLKRSDRVVVSGTLKKGFGSYAATLQSGSVVKHVARSDVARDARDQFADGVRRAISEPQASLGIGYIVGQRSSLPTDLDKKLQVVGLTHIVVASGYNLTILVRLARRLFEKISKFLTAVFSGSLIAGFLLVTGFSPSMSRASLVAVLSLAAWYYGRKISPFVILPLAASITVVINPTYVWGNVGWFLSFAAFAGVMILAPLLQNYFFGPKRPGFIRQVVGETLSATIATIPIIVIVFGHYSLYALPANVLVVPLIPLAMLLVFVAGLAGLLLPGLASVFGLPAQSVLDYMTTVVDRVASLPGAYGETQFSVLATVLYYIALILFGIFMWRKTRHNFLDNNIVE